MCLCVCVTTYFSKSTGEDLDETNIFITIIYWQKGFILKLFWQLFGNTVVTLFHIKYIVVYKIHSVFKGALVSALADDTLHLWNLRQKRPAILHSLKFCRER